jgi:hypothetical protein
MSTAAQEIGREFQEHVVAFLRTRFGLEVERTRHGRPGRVSGLPGYVVHVADRAGLSQGAWETEQEAADSDASPVTVVRRRGHPIERAYVVLALEDFAQLILTAHPEWSSIKPLSATPPTPQPMTNLRACNHCGNPFVASNGNQRFDTRSCRDRAQRQRDREKKALAA